MELLNETRASVELIRSIQTDEEDLLAVLVAKLTYSIDDDGNLVDEFEDPLPILREPFETELGVVPADIVQYKPAVDLMVFGHASAPDGRPTTSMRVQMKIGDWSQSIAVFGDRCWERRGDSFVSTTPEPFVKMPLTWTRAFGGCAPARGSEVPHPYNPAGRGYNLLGESVGGSRLPNVEDPDALIKTWIDNPLPISLGAAPFASMFTADTCDLHSQGGESAYVYAGDNRAHPKLRIPKESFRGTMTIDGMSSQGRLTFQIPRNEFSAEVWLADRHYSFPLELDTLVVFADSKRVSAVYRCRFTYAVVEGEQRLVRLRSVR